MENYINNLINKKYNTDRGYLYFVDLLLEKYPDFKINYDNLKSLKFDSITKDMFLDSGYTGLYTISDNKIRIFTNYDEDGNKIFPELDISDDELINTFVHELIHCLTSRMENTMVYEGFNMRQDGQSSYFLGLNEGITQMIADDLLESESDAYVFQTIFARQLAEIVGKEKLVTMYSGNDIESLSNSIMMLDKNFDFRSFVVETYIFNMINCGYKVQDSENIGTKIQERLISLNGSLKNNNFKDYILTEEKVLKLMEYLPIPATKVDDCGFKGIGSISVDNPSKKI